MALAIRLFWYNLARLDRFFGGHFMGDRWQLQEAKNRLSELVRKAREDGPQVITIHGTDAVVVMAADQFRKLSSRKGTLMEFFRRSPLVGVDLDVARSRDRGRPVTL
jgi:prevent-host-death family protein